MAFRFGIAQQHYSTTEQQKKEQIQKRRYSNGSARAASQGSRLPEFSSRLQVSVYNSVNDWAWERRMTFAKACSVLLSKAIAAEMGGEYVPETAKHQGRDAAV